MTSSRLALGALLLFVLLPGALLAQENDADFDTSVGCPAYAPGVGPRLLIDEAHKNLHRASGRYASFAAVAERDGFRVEPATTVFSENPPPEGAILVIANARGAEKDEDAAFSPAEVERLRSWVAAGGSLFLIADHAPFGSAAASLSAAFGVEMIDGHVRDAEHRAAELPGPFFLEFTRDNALLGQHPILTGRSPGENLKRVVSFGGQALRPGPGAVVLLRLGPKAESVANPNDTASPVQGVGGLAQAVALEVGKGRVVVVGEAGLFGAQVIRGEAARKAGLPGDLRFGMNHPGTDDRQLLLNILHWVSRLL
jgi:hypothetical protein